MIDKNDDTKTGFEDSLLVILNQVNRILRNQFNNSDVQLKDLKFEIKDIRLRRYCHSDDPLSELEKIEDFKDIPVGAVIFIELSLEINGNTRMFGGNFMKDGTKKGMNKGHNLIPLDPALPPFQQMDSDIDPEDVTKDELELKPEIIVKLNKVDLIIRVVLTIINIGLGILK